MKNRNSVCHLTDKFRCNFFIYFYQIFFFMIITCPHDPVYQIALIGQKKESFGFFIQTSYRINAQRIIQVFGHSSFLALLFGAAYDSARFIKKEKNLLFFYMYRFSVQTDHRIRRNPLSCGNFFSVCSDTSGICVLVGFPTGTDTDVA